MMKKIFLVVLLSGAIQPALGDSNSASQVELESAWLAFANAKGEASLILGDVEHPSANDVFRIIPDVSADSLDEEKLQLGSALFRERRLSRDGSVACTSCHIDMMGGVDRRPVSFGIDGAQGTLNAPTVFNAALNFRQFWDGRALTLQEQALGPIENPAEFGHDLDSVVAVLKSIPDYVSAFDRLYPDGATTANLSDAIAYYETMTFTGLESAFLRQFQQQQEPLSRQALRGQQRFVEVGCASCHNGVNLGGNSYQQLGAAEPWYGIDRPASEADDGLFGRTGREQDQHMFKVPTLHNVALTGPWLHDGSITSLAQAVDQMARHQLGRYLENNDIDDIVAFLRALGDSLGMLGDCSASGSYTIAMDCSVNPRAKGAKQDAAARVALPDPAVLARRHQEEYSAALNRAAEAPMRIAEEMQRIRSGAVAHYDFLQYEHIEMLRHARALSFPPANLEPEQREAMLSQAAQWQQTAEQYELIIADFLRSQALASSAKANYQDLLRILSAAADEKTLSLLAQAEQSALAFYAQPRTDTQLEFESSTLALLGINLNPQRLEELQLQVRLLLENVAIPQV
ncbi:MAG: c-type cytochrome [Pseudohongiella sp.]|nr:c-type cytochrome [Pseudohongiella sp.]